MSLTRTFKRRPAAISMNLVRITRQAKDHLTAYLATVNNGKIRINASHFISDAIDEKIAREKFPAPQRSKIIISKQTEK